MNSTGCCRNKFFAVGMIVFAILLICIIGCGGSDDEPVQNTPTSELYVVNSANNSVSVFDPSADGNVSALRQFGNLTGLKSPVGIAVDTVNNQIFVANNGNNSITVYGRTDTGNIAPVRTISGANTGLHGPVGIAVQ